MKTLTNTLIKLAIIGFIALVAFAGCEAYKQVKAGNFHEYASL